MSSTVPWTAEPPALAVDHLQVSVPPPKPTPLYINRKTTSPRSTFLKTPFRRRHLRSAWCNGVIAIATKRQLPAVPRVEFGTSFGASAGCLKNHEVPRRCRVPAAIKKYNQWVYPDGGATIDAPERTQSTLSSDYSLALSSEMISESSALLFLAAPAVS